MANTEGLISNLYSVLSDISHPIEGTFYLFLLAIIFRRGWPKIWNNFLKNISAPVENNLSEDGKSKAIPSSDLSDSVIPGVPSQGEQRKEFD